jgi:hypothetical protein
MCAKVAENVSVPTTASATTSRIDNLLNDDDQGKNYFNVINSSP